VQHLEKITAPFFPTLAELGEFRLVAVDDMPQSYQTLLAHDAHMTVTVEAFHNSMVDVQVLDEHRDGDYYSRTSLLICRSNRRIVQFGIMRIDLSGLPPIVREEIESRGTPLGRILIRHNVLRHVELHRLWRIKPGPELRRRLIYQIAPQTVPPAGKTPAKDDDSSISAFNVAKIETQTAAGNERLYGRTARIVVEGRPAVELLEIVKA
jgi:chorismate-pyruvate lyase